MHIEKERKRTCGARCCPRPRRRPRKGLPRLLVVILATVPALNLTAQGARPQRPTPPARISFNDLARTASASRHAPIRISDVPLPGLGHVELTLEPFSVTRPDTRFVVGSAHSGGSGGSGGSRGTDRPLRYDPSRIKLFRGDVKGHPGSHVFLAVRDAGKDTHITGYIDLQAAAGNDRARYVLSSRGAADQHGPLVSKVHGAGSLPPQVPLCGVQTLGGPDLPQPPPPVVTTTRVIELAIETDYELFGLFGDLQAVADYVTILYAAVSDVYLRDVDARIELSFVRLWDNPLDLFNEPNPLGPFRIYWNANMTHVHRDVAQFLSGRRDFPFGGAAYLSALCGAAGYSVVGYALGPLAEYDGPGIYTYDLRVTAHELGHNFGTLHTHNYGLDTCNDPDGTPQRGTIMSYCSQTVSGGSSNSDVRFHTFVQGVMRDYLDTIACLHADCNDNGIDDALDIADATSADANGNSIPDECEDCNGNGTLDDQDISSGGSTDLNANGVPDECEPDCNGNSVPDDMDIDVGTSFDLHGNGIPDECEVDCDGNGLMDYNEIQADLSLDINRNAVLDACEDCDGDGVTDLEALAGAHHIWVASEFDGTLRELHSRTGVLMSVSVTGQISPGQDVLIDPTGRIFVSFGAANRVGQFDRSGTYVGGFVSAGSGGLSSPTGLAFTGDGNLLVASRGTDSVLEYDGHTGVFLGDFIQGGSGGLDGPFGLTFGPNGNLFVTSATNEVVEYDGASGALMGTFVSAIHNGGLTDPRGLVFKPDGNLLVASFGTNQVLEYDAVTGAFIAQFNHGGTATALTLDGPWGIRIGPDGFVYVSRHNVVPQSDGGGSTPGPHLHINSSRIYIFHPDTGNFIRSHVMGNDTELWLPTGFDFYPNPGIDCNVNALPDSCDITSGRSADANANGVPDECECLGDLSGDGAVNVLDLIELLLCFGQHVGPPCDVADLNADGSVNVLDLIALLVAFGTVCP